MHVGGIKGSISGNFAMEDAKLLIPSARARSASRTAPASATRIAKAVININGDLTDVGHYNRTTTLPGDIGAVIGALLAELAMFSRRRGGGRRAGRLRRQEAGVGAFKADRCGEVRLHDPFWSGG